MKLSFQLPRFEGPLALLLYLIRKEEMDILDIPIHRITEQYLEHLKMMRELDLELAGEFISMAATLMHIKSRMLLPQYNEQGELVEAEDPRKELVNRLLEYERFQQISRDLYERPLLGRDYWTRGAQEELPPPQEELIIEENALFQLIASFRRVMMNLEKKIHEVAGKIQSIASRVLEIKEFLVVGTRTRLADLLTHSRVDAQDFRRQTLITFLSLLELGKLGFVKLFQLDHLSDIHIETLRKIETDVISRVEEYGQMPELGSHFLSSIVSSSRLPMDDFDLLNEPDLDAEISSLSSVSTQVQLELDTALAPEGIATDDDILEAEKSLGLHEGERSV
ncbi:MAG: segregation/condensation protein A [Bdellovibrio sp.]